MKQYRYSYLVVMALAMASLLLSCTENADYMEVIPRDAMAVGRADASALKSIAEAVGLKLGTDGMEPAGLDLSQPIGLFYTKEGRLGAVAAVADKELLQAWLAKGYGEIATAHDYSWATVEGRWLIGFDDNRALMMGPAAKNGDMDGMKRDMLRCLNLQAGSSTVSELYKLAFNNEEPIAVAIAPEALPMEVRRTAAAGVGINSRKDALLLLTVKGGDGGEITAKVTVAASTETVRARMRVLDETFFHPIEGSLLGMTPLDTKMLVACNLDGSHIIKALRGNEGLRTGLVMMNRVIDVDAIIQSIRGDITLAVTDYKNGLDADGVLTATIASKSFMRQRDYWVESAKGQKGYTLEALPMQRLAFAMGETRLWFGQVNDIVVVATQDSLSQIKGVRGNTYLLKRKNDIKGLRFYATMDLRDAPMNFTSAERMDIEMHSTGELTLRLFTRKK